MMMNRLINQIRVLIYDYRLIEYVLMAALFAAGLILAGCNGNHRPNQQSGIQYVDLDAGQKLMNVTWKDDTLWVLTRKFLDDESQEDYTFKGKSLYGTQASTIIIREH